MISLNDQRKQFWVILVIVFLGFLGISMPYLIFPSLFLNPDYSILPEHWSTSARAMFLGMTLAAYPLGQFVGSPILGSLSDDYGRKRILSWSLLIAAICYFFSGLAIAFQQLGLLIASRFVAGLMEGNIAIARALAADLTTISKHESFGKINAVASIAFLLGPLLGGVMTEKSLFQDLTAASPFYMTCLLFLGIALLSAVVLSGGKSALQSSKKTFLQRVNLLKRLQVLFENKHLQFLMIVSTCFTIAVDIFYEFGPVFLTVKWSLSPAQLVLYNGIICIALAFGNGWLPAFISNRFSNRFAVICSTGLLPMLLVGMVLTNSSILMMLFCTLSGLCIGLATTVMTINISNAVSDQIQGEVLGVQLSLRVLGDAIICLFGGALLILSSKLILLIAGIISLLTMTYYAFSTRKKVLQEV